MLDGEIVCGPEDGSFRVLNFMMIMIHDGYEDEPSIHGVHTVG